LFSESLTAYVTLRVNPGAFLSFGQHLSPDLRMWLFVCGNAMISAAAIVYAVSDSELFLPLVLIGAGGAGNVIDRLVHQGSVVDYLALRVSTLSTGVFNFADVLITAAAMVLLVKTVRKR
jgi:lipoprotein signal peptidase